MHMHHAPHERRNNMTALHLFIDIFILLFIKMFLYFVQHCQLDLCYFYSRTHHAIQKILFSGGGCEATFEGVWRGDLPHPSRLEGLGSVSPSGVRGGAAPRPKTDICAF